MQPTTAEHGPIPPNLTPWDLAKQFWRDIYGKEVQTASTYSYTWVADQVGHLCIGVVASFVVTRFFDWLTPDTVLCSPCVGFVIASIGVSVWEVSAYYSAVEQAGNATFELDKKLLRDNAIIAAVYMILGVFVGWTFHDPVSWSVPAFAVVTALAVVLAPWWLRQKITWQKAGLPYIARLADLDEVNLTVKPDWAGELQGIIRNSAALKKPPRIVVIAGPVGSGRTWVASAIGTECAFVGASVRYLNFDDLLELAAEEPKPNYELGLPPPGPANIGFWPWSQAQVLIIENVGPVIAASADAVAAVQGGTLGAWLDEKLGTIHDALNNRHTIWIMGQLGAKNQDQLEESANAIGDFLSSVQPPLAMLMKSISVRTKVNHLVFWGRRAGRFLTGLPNASLRQRRPEAGPIERRASVAKCRPQSRRRPAEMVWLRRPWPLLLRPYSVVFPSKCSSVASASALVSRTTPSRCSGGP